MTRQNKMAMFKKPKCPMCTMCLRNNQRMICCDICNNWIHFKCTSLPTKQFKLLGDSKEPYFCNNCLRNIIPFQKLTHFKFANLYSRAQIEMSKEINHVLNSLDVHSTSEYLKAYEIKKSFYKANSISVIHVSIRSLAKNFYKLEELLHEMQVQPDIIAVTEI